MTAKRGPRWPLGVDLIPQSAWFSNLRSELTAAEWTAVQRTTFAAAGHRCEVCAGRGRRWPVECHERWSFDPQTGVQGMQTLLGTIALCPACHEATHFGLAEVRGRSDVAARHLMRVNGWNASETAAHVAAAFALYQTRSRMAWRLDARWLLEQDEIVVSEATRGRILAHAAGRVRRT